jgi:hypothetical protein
LLLCFLAQCSHIQNHRMLEMGNGTASLVRGVTNYWTPWLQCQDKQLLVNLPTWQNWENFNSGLVFSSYCIWKEVDGIHVHLCVPNKLSIFMKICYKSCLFFTSHLYTSFFLQFCHPELHVLVLTDRYQVHFMCYTQVTALLMQIYILFSPVNESLIKIFQFMLFRWF